MKQVTVSSKFQVVIPREVRESMDIQPGTRVQVLQYENRIELIPLRDPNLCEGLSRGLIRRWIAPRIEYEPGGFLRLAGVLCRRPQC